jgi:hypothetical protein
MKKYNWSVEVFAPNNLTDNIWFSTEETLEKVCKKWYEECGNNYLNYHKLHNIYHQRNKGDNMLIKVLKIEV